MKRVQALKDDLVLQVAFEAGPFWSEVRKMRLDWGIEAPVQLPPKEEDFEWTYPQQPLNEEDAARLAMPAALWGQRLIGLGRWLKEERGPRFTERVNFLPFLAALVRYQPPREHLREFAEYGGMPLIRDWPWNRRSFLRRDRGLLESLITVQPHPSDVIGSWQRYYETLLEEIDERFLKPQGLNIHSMRSQVEEEKQLNKQLKKDLREAPRHTYIRIDEEATVPELRNAVGRAAGRRKQGPTVGRDPRRKLITVELAYRHDHLGQRWLDLTERYPGLTLATLEKYLKDGRKFLPNNRRR